MLDKNIARTLLRAPSKQKWTIYQNQFHDFFAGRWPEFDQLISFIQEVFSTSGHFPTLQSYEIELAAANDQVLLTYVRETAQDELIAVHHEDADFASALRVLKNQLFKSELLVATRGLEGVITGPAAHPPVVRRALNSMLNAVYHSQQRAFSSEAADTTVLYGQRALQELVEHYETIEAKQREGELFYELPFPKLADVRIKPGDLVFVGAYTSQGKSMLLRALAYHFVVRYGLNVGFWSLEMSRDAVPTQMTLLHANNKKIFPATPKVPVDAYKNGQLDNEKKDFLFSEADRDFTQNPNYGTLLIEQPNKADFGIADLAQRLAMIEQTEMPVHVLVIDYITYMNPVPAGRMAPVRIDDYNTMIKQLKRFCLTYRNHEGQAAPLICLTAAQISRKGYEEAMKRDGLYDLQAFSTYTEIERSADIAMTVLMTPEMRNARQLKLQVLKNRDGVVPPEPLTLNVDFEHGSSLRQLDERDPMETSHALRSLAF